MTNISDVRQVRTLNDANDYCIVCTNGLMGQPYDMLEHRQDMCIRLNAWQNCDSWVTLNNKDVEEMLNDFFDLFEQFKKDGDN